MTARRDTVDLVVLDRDGVINYDSDEYIKSPAEWRALPGSIEAIARLTRAGFRVVVVTNQSGVGRGLLSEDALAAIHAKMRAEIEAGGGRLAGIYYCPHRPDEGCTCRKPAPGLLVEVGRDFGCTLEGVAVIGDKLSDLEAAAAVGARPILVRTGRGAATLGQLEGLAHEVHADLAAATEALLTAKHGH